MQNPLAIVQTFVTCWKRYCCFTSCRRVGWWSIPPSSIGYSAHQLPCFLSMNLGDVHEPWGCGSLGLPESSQNDSNKMTKCVVFEVYCMDVFGPFFHISVGFPRQRWLMFHSYLRWIWDDGFFCVPPLLLLAFKFAWGGFRNVAISYIKLREFDCGLFACQKLC